MHHTIELCDIEWCYDTFIYMRPLTIYKTVSLDSSSQLWRQPSFDNKIKSAASLVFITVRRFLYDSQLPTEE